MLFSQIIGQQTAKNGLFRMWKQDKLPHALLITGKEGVGGLPFALATARFALCNNKQQEDACGRCDNCIKTGKYEHADLHFSFPSFPPKPGTKAMSRHFIRDFREYLKNTPYGSTYDWLQYISAENKQGNITADECREIIDRLYLKSYEGGMKVQIIWRPEYLGKEGNILLKLIEEPPANTLLLFVAEDTEAILPTILSRTQQILLAPLSLSDITGALVAAKNLSETEALQIAHMAEGSYDKALQLLQHNTHDFFPEIRRWFNAVFTGNGTELSKIADEWSKMGREQQKKYLSYTTGLLGHAFRISYAPNIPLHLTEAENVFVRKLAAQNFPHEHYDAMTAALENALLHIERNAHAKTQLHALSLKMIRIIRKPL